MAISVQAASALAALLGEEVREVAAFVELLRQEQSLLTAAGSGDSLMPLIERKSEFVVRLKALADRREHILGTAGLGSGRAAMEAWLGTSHGTAPAASVWQRLLALAAEARQLNETNGKLIGIHWQHNQAALAALMSAANGATTYGPDGQQRSGGGRSFGSA